jgi:ubiquinone/menaquinone biosynthesis C-methylase UbiE
MTHTAWYECYFGPDYLRIYRLADTPDQLAFLERVVTLPPGGRLLDVCCGHGRHATVLAGRGLHVTGFDLSAPFLRVAQERARELGVPLELVRADVRFFPFRPAAFDMAISMFTSFGYFDDDPDNARVLHEVARVLQPGARYVLDLANPDFVRRQPPTSGWEHEGTQVVTTYTYHEQTRRANTHRTATFPDGRQEVYASSVRMYEQEEIEGLLTAAGLRVQTIYGSYDGEPLHPSRKRMILIAERG